MFCNYNVKWDHFLVPACAKFARQQFRNLPQNYKMKLQILYWYRISYYSLSCKTVFGVFSRCKSVWQHALVVTLHDSNFHFISTYFKSEKVCNEWKTCSWTLPEIQERELSPELFLRWFSFRCTLPAASAFFDSTAHHPPIRLSPLFSFGRYSCWRHSWVFPFCFSIENGRNPESVSRFLLVVEDGSVKYQVSYRRSLRQDSSANE